MKKEYKTLTRTYLVSDESVIDGHVMLVGRITKTGLIVDSVVLPIDEFPKYINDKLIIIQPEEMRMKTYKKN